MEFTVDCGLMDARHEKQMIELHLPNAGLLSPCSQ